MAFILYFSSVHGFELVCGDICLLGCVCVSFSSVLELTQLHVVESRAKFSVFSVYSFAFLASLCESMSLFVAVCVSFSWKTHPSPSDYNVPHRCLCVGGGM